MDETVRIVVEIKPSGKYSDCHCNLFQCCGSVIFWYGSGSADPYLWPVFRIHNIWFGSGSADPCFCLIDPDSDPDPDPTIFVIDLQDANKKRIFWKSFSAYYFLKAHLYYFSKIKSPKEVTKQLESRFFLLILLDDRRIRIPEGRKHVDPDLYPGGPKTSGSGSGTLPLNNGSGSNSGSDSFIRWP